MNKVNALEYSIMVSFLTIMLLGVNQGFSQTNDTQLKTYQNEELGVSFQYPSNWSEMDEQSRKQITEMMKQSLIGQNLTINEKAYSETESVTFLHNQDPNNFLGVTLVKYEFPSSISVEEFNQIAFKLTNLMGFKATLVENVNTTISNQEANRAAIMIDEGPAKGELISIAFFEGNTVTNLQLGAVNNEDQASVIEKIIDSIKINNQTF
ncbi:MAG: hypothetical protein QOK64_05200 [Nitrososphaeraceae archaeon]|nr:hypothetical protein [Nitrososphaeraceae archaeon]